MSEVAFRIRARWSAVAGEFDLTPMQGLALWRLDPETPVPMNALASILGCDSSNVTGIIDKLEARRLVERRASESDRRVKMLAVTAKGAKLRARFLEQSSIPPQSVAELSAAEQQYLVDLLDKVLASGF